MQSTRFLKKGYLLAALAFVLTLLSARFAFWNTWQAWQLNKQLNSRIGEASDISFQPGYLERKGKNLAKAIYLYQVDTLAYRNMVLTSISSLAEKEKVRIVDVPTEGNNSYYQTRLYKVEKIELEGEYTNLMRFYNQLFSIKGIGMIRSVLFTHLQQRGLVKVEGSLRLLMYLEIKR